MTGDSVTAKRSNEPSGAGIATVSDSAAVASAGAAVRAVAIVPRSSRKAAKRFGADERVRVCGRRRRRRGDPMPGGRW